MFLLIIPFIGGTVMGSWWSLILVPGAFGLGVELWRATECAGCPPGETDALRFETVLIIIGIQATIILAAAAGTAVAKRLDWTGNQAPGS